MSDLVNEFLLDLLLRSSGKAPRPGIREQPLEIRREYNRLAKARSRGRQRTTKQDARSPLPNADEVREALADAALMILAVDGPGADHVRNVLGRCFPDRVGVPMTVTARAKAGALKPRSRTIKVAASQVA